MKIDFQNLVLIVLVLNLIILDIKTISIKSNLAKFENLDNCGEFKYNVNQLVIGGSEATSGQFPWQVSLQKRSGSLWFHVCGAVILNNSWILSAAHCINGLDESSLRAVVGSNYLDRNGIGYDIEKITKHESYSSKTLANDLAVIRVKTEINFNGLVNSVCLPPEGQKFTQYVTLSGWGTTVSGGQTPSNQLMFVNEVPIVSLPKCRSIYGFNAIRDGMLCAGVQQQQLVKGFCKGDGGGPLIQVDPSGKAVLVGISSFNRNCGSDDGIPDVFVEISSFRDWIDTTTAQ